MKKMKILYLDNCHDCPHIGTNGVNKIKVCCLTGDNVNEFDSNFMKEPSFPPTCPLKDYTQYKPKRIIGRRIV